MTTIERDPATLSRYERSLLRFPPERREAAARLWMETLPYDVRRNLRFAWEQRFARPTQILPEGAWDTFMLRAGRGSGKTRAGAEGVRALVNRGRARYVTIVGKTPAEARDVMVEGPVGLLAVHPPEVRPTYEPSKRLVTWPNGAIGHVRSAADPDSCRGLNSDLIWFDEPASMRFGKEAWDNAVLGNRIGEPHAILTGTPRPLPWLRDIESRSGTVLVRSTTYENVANLAPAFVELILDRYEGTRLGRQELHAEYLEDVEGALWTLAQIEAARFVRFDRDVPWKALAVGLAKTNAAFGRGTEVFTGERRAWATVVGVDPSAGTAECGIVAATAPKSARVRDHAVVLDDRSLEGPPERWGAQVVACYHDLAADLVLVEANQGGDMCRATIHNVDPTVRVEKVRAAMSKGERADPVSVLYARGRVHHLGVFPQLEDQMCSWVAGEGKSPDRVDALVHAVNWLLPPSSVRQSMLPDQRARAATQL